MQQAVAEATGSSNDVAVSAVWRLVGNLPDNRFQAELTLRNDADEPLAPRWALYFNSSARIAPESIEPPFALSHVNGDLYVLRPDKTCPPIGAGEERALRMTGSPWAINVSDAPSGLYFVPIDSKDAELPPVIVPLEIGPFPDAVKIRRGADDQVPVVTAAARFVANAALTKLPSDDLSPVVPTPVAFAKLSGAFTIDGSTSIAFESSLENEARLLAAAFRESFGLNLKLRPASKGAMNSIHLTLGKVKFDDASSRVDDEAYTLTVSPGIGVEIVGTDPAGVFYGIQTLRGLAPLAAYRAPGKPVSIAAVKIADAPRFGYRGLHLDVARNVQSVETVKKLLELMAFYKLNRFHWHLTDDEGWRIEIKSLPELTTVGGRRGHTHSETDHLIPSLGSGPFSDPEKSPGSGCYTQDEFIDILRFAHARHISVIPEIDAPGHSRAAIKAMAVRGRRADSSSRDFRLTDPDDQSQYESVQAWHDNVVDVGREATYEFLDVVFGELADMYRRAGVPFEVVHLGGDEVPQGAWESSPACRSILTPDPKLARGQQLELYFLKRACGLVVKHGATPACWDDCLLFATGDTDWPKRPMAYVWNSVWGWGREDVAYQLANAGFDVVLCNATDLYFDLAYEKDPFEPGYYWAGFVDARAPFEFNPLDIFQNARNNSMGQPLAADQFALSVRLNTTGRKHVVGIQGQLWSENLRSPALLEYMAFPRTIALAERAWAAEPIFTTIEDSPVRKQEFARAWNQFANCLGQRELPRLSYLAGGVEYRIPPPGVIVRDGAVHANVALPGLLIRYTSDGTEPLTSSPIFERPMVIRPNLRLRTFDTGGHGSRTVIVSQLSDE